MDRLWTPWRFNYITGRQTGRGGVPQALEDWPGEDKHCVFCNMLAAVAWAVSTGMPAAEAEKAAFILTIRPNTFACLNAFPYTSGHMLLLPLEHTASLAALPPTTAHELTDLAQQAERALRNAYTPHGLNFGINLGEAAGAGVANHLHLHALPRWTGDASFLTTVGETRILPELLEVTWEKLRREMTIGQP